MDLCQAWARGDANRRKELMVFDWNKAAQLIKKNKNAIIAAGLKGDEEHTKGIIWKCGKIVPKEETYCYLASTWAIPQIEINGEKEDCFIMKSNMPSEWIANSKDCAEIYFPQSALDILTS